MKKSDKAIRDHIFDFLEYCEIKKGMAVNSIKNYDNFLKAFVEWLEKNKLHNLPPHKLSAKHINDYQIFLTEKRDKNDNRIKKTSQNYYLVALRSLMQYFVSNDIGSFDPVKIKLPKLTAHDKAIKILNSGQIKRLFDMPDVSKPDGLRDRAILEALFSTGLRVSELTSLNINQFKSPKMDVSISGKGGKVRHINFSKRALGWLFKYIKVRKDMYTPLFINYRKDDNDDEHRLTARSVERLVRKYTTMAGLPVEATPHTLRHSYAADLLKQGVDMHSVQELLGHKNIVNTQIYSNVNGNNKE